MSIEQERSSKTDSCDALSRMESCYIEKKKQCELLQTEIARLNNTVERLKTEKLSMQVRIDELSKAVSFALGHCEGLRGFHAELDDYVNMASKTILGAI